jgi:RHS repeat-associated protein
VLTDSVNTYTWNAEGKMATVSGSLGSAAYLYDGDGQRVEKSSGKLYWYGSDGNVLSESDLSGNITDDYIFLNGQRIARVDSSGNIDYYLSDALSSARVVTDSNGNILDDCDFLPFGDEQCVASASGNTYQFTGMELDAESQLNHTLNRQFSSIYGRWLSPDPGNAGANPSNPQTWNAYSYALDNPTTNTDPTGRNVYVCAYTDANGGLNCFTVTDQQYAALVQGQNSQQQGINLPSGNMPAGSITCGGQVCGSVSYFEQGIENDAGSDLAIGGFLGEGLDAVGSLLESGAQAAGRLLGIGAGEEATAETATVTVTATAGVMAPELATADAVVQKAVSTVGNQSVTVASEDAAGQAADEFLGPGKTPALDRNTGQMVGWKSADGTEVVVGPHVDATGPHYNFRNLLTGGNLHVRW